MRLAHQLLVAAIAAAPIAADAEPQEADGSEDTPQPAGDTTRTEPAAEALPEPTAASNMVVGPEEPSALRWVGRAALFLPRVAFEVINAPVRGAFYVEGNYHVVERTKRVLFNDAETFGVYPIAAFRSGFGISTGLKVVHLDVAGASESLSAKALYGGRYDQEYRLSASTGDRLGRTELSAGLALELRPKERFFGIGNGDLVGAETVTAPIDPTIDDTAVSTRYREVAYDVRLDADIELARNVFARARGRLERREVERSDELSDDAALTDVYDPGALVGVDEALDSAYAELELRYDSRRRSQRFASSAMPGAGVLVAARVGFSHGLDSAPVRDYLRYTADIQKYFNIYDGTRVFGLRLLVSQIDADLGEIPFVYLPRLGGDALLRGYQTDRFYDRGLTLASAEYKWELVPRYVAAFAFTDAGRVQRSVLDPDLDDLRVGFGAGLQLHTLNSFLLRTHVASSIDGGVFLHLGFDPVSEQRVRDKP